jgi:hypothetical protein
MNEKEFDQRITALQASTRTTEFDFPSSTPIIGKLIRALRLAWNNVSARWYVKDYARQQLGFQRQLIQLLQATQQEQVQLQNQVTILKDQLAEKDRRLSAAQQMLERDIAALAQHQLHQPQ